MDPAHGALTPPATTNPGRIEVRLRDERRILDAAGIGLARARPPGTAQGARFVGPCSSNFASMSIEATMTELVTLLRRVHVLGTIGELLGWDEQVNLPSGAMEQRTAQVSALAEVIHAAASNTRIGRLLETLEAAGTTPGSEAPTADQRAIVWQARRDFDRAVKLPAAFVREKAEAGSRGYHAWARARAERDFAAYAPVLEANIELARREAAYLGQGERPYDYLIDTHDPGMTEATVARLFADLEQGLRPLVRRITASPAAARGRTAARRLQGFPVEAQRAFLRRITEQIGFDFRRGRIDVSLHPFCSGTGCDVRMTTRYNPNQPLDALFGSIHETGHGLYEQGLASAHLGTALAMPAGMAVHESQSRLWENQVARSRAFWRFFEPEWRQHFPTQAAAVSSEELHLAINAVQPTVIRVDADEVTYNLHIILRFGLERRLLAGDLAVRDLPEAWRAASRDLLGIEPAHDGEGVLQDVHWSDGAFGYFPSYCLGNMIAAQLWQRVRTLRPDLEADFERGDFGWLLGWLREHIHAPGRRHNALELVRQATGAELSPRPLLEYLGERYSRLFPA